MENERCTCHDVLIVKNLNRWFKEKWVDVSRKDKDGKHPPCGRKKAKKGSKGYPKCRPSVKVSSKTPKTSGSMSEGQKRAATKRKRSKKQGVGGKPTIVKGMSDDEREDDFQTQLHLAQLTDQKRDESVEQYHQRMANTCPCGSGQPAVPNAHFEEPRCMTCIRENSKNFMSQLFLPQEEFETVQTNARPDQRTHPYSAGRYDQYPFGYDWSQKNAGEAMDLSFRLLKRPVSPEAKRHKLEYDTKYESTPERVKYREELKRERRQRGIEGKGGPDMSHTKDHTLVAEDPHTNRARHFKERGTLKGDPMDIAWLLLKFDLDQRSPDDMDEFERREEDLMRQFNRQRTPEQTLSRGQLRRLEQGRPVRGQQTKNFVANPEVVERASEKLRAIRMAQNQEIARRKLEESIDAAETHPGRQGTSDFTQVRDLYQTMHPTEGDIYNSRTYGTPPLEAMKDSRMKDAHVRFEFNSRDAQRAKTAGQFDKRQDLATLLGAMGFIPPEAGIYLNPPDTGSETLDVKEFLRQQYEVPRVHMAFPPRAQIGGVSNPSEPYPTFQGSPFRTEEDSMFGVPFTTGEPMDLSFRLLKGEW